MRALCKRGRVDQHSQFINAERRLRARLSLIWTDAPGIVRMGVFLAFVFPVLIFILKGWLT